MGVNDAVRAFVMEWLQQHSKSYQWLADELGVSKSLVQHMVTGRRTFTTDRIKQLAQVLDVSIDELIHATNKPATYSLQLRGKISTREGRSALEDVIFACLREDEMLHLKEADPTSIRGDYS